MNISLVEVEADIFSVQIRIYLLDFDLLPVPYIPDLILDGRRSP